MRGRRDGRRASRFARARAMPCEPTRWRHVGGPLVRKIPELLAAQSAGLQTRGLHGVLSGSEGGVRIFANADCVRTKAIAIADAIACHPAFGPDLGSGHRTEQPRLDILMMQHVPACFPSGGREARERRQRQLSSSGGLDRSWSDLSQHRRARPKLPDLARAAREPHARSTGDGRRWHVLSWAGGGA